MIDLAAAYARRDDYLKALLVLKAAAELDPMSEVIFELVPVYQERLQRQLDGEELDDHTAEDDSTDSSDDESAEEGEPVEGDAAEEGEPVEGDAADDADGGDEEPAAAPDDE